MRVLTDGTVAPESEVRSGSPTGTLSVARRTVVA